jgi:hypothetical protein
MVEGLTDAQIIERLLRLERSVERIASHLGVEIENPSAGLDPDVVALARSGDRMGAAKLLVDRTGTDFVSAQRVVNDL